MIQRETMEYFLAMNANKCSKHVSAGKVMLPLILIYSFLREDKQSWSMIKYRWINAVDTLLMFSTLDEYLFALIHTLHTY